jgi:hypothetical protein
MPGTRHLESSTKCRLSRTRPTLLHQRGSALDNRFRNRCLAGVIFLVAGVIFLVMGLNGFLHFIPFPPPPGIAGQFMGALYVSHCLRVIFAFQVIAGALLLVNRYFPLAVAVLAPVLSLPMRPRQQGAISSSLRPCRWWAGIIPAL